MTVVEVYPCRQIIAMSFEMDLLHRHDCWLCSKAKKTHKTTQLYIKINISRFPEQRF